MPDKDDVLGRMGGDGDGGSKSKSSSSSKSSDSSKSSSGAKPFKLSDDQRTSPDEVEVSDASESLASGAELNYDKGTTSLKKYKKQQVKEVRELHDDMYKTAKKHSDDIAQFTLVFHAMMMNFSQNRVGIARTIRDNFGKSEKQATKIATQICKKAGEGETFVKIADLLTEKMME